MFHPKIGEKQSELDLSGEIIFTDNKSSDQSEAPALQPKKQFPWKKVILIAIIILLLSGLGVLGMFGYDFYQKNVKTLPILTLLPADPNLVITATLNPDAQQYKLLEANFQKFPGYKLWQQKIDPNGSGKTMSQTLQDKMQKYNLDFQKDLQPILDDKGYIVISDLKPLGDAIQSPYSITSSIDSKSSDNSIFSNKLDFIAAIQIKNLDQAKQVFQKMQSSSSYKITPQTYKGYTYYKLEATQSDSSSAYPNLYNAIIGGNWFVASSEKDIILAMDKALAQNDILQKTKIPALSENADFQTIEKNLANNINNDKLFSAYLKLNFNKFFKKDCPDPTNCSSIADYLKYPDDLIMGVNFAANSDGLGISVVSNQRNLSGVQNIAFANGTVKDIPSQTDGRWADIFAEYANPKDIYYYSKQNNLTSKGSEKLTEVLAEINKDLNIDFEKDIIDQLNGNVSFALFTQAGLESEGALIVPVKDGQQMRATLEKITQAIKKQMLDSYSSMEQLTKTPSKDPFMQKYQADLKKKIADLNAAQLNSQQTPAGTIYSFKASEWISFDFSVENNILILSSHYAAVDSLLKSLGNKNQDSLAANPLYQRSSQYSLTQGFAQSFVVTQGIINTISFYYNKFMAELQSSTKSLPSDTVASKPQTDPLYPYSAILRTIKFVRFSQATDDSFLRSSVFFDLKELPAAEKQAAEDTLQQQDDKSKTGF